MIKKFLRGMLIGISISSIGLLGTFLFIQSIKFLNDFSRNNHLNPSLVGGIVFIILGSLLYGVLSVNNKV